METKSSVAECASAPLADERQSAKSAGVTAVTVADPQAATRSDEGGAGYAGEPAILEEIEVEELAVDGICGVY